MTTYPKISTLVDKFTYVALSLSKWSAIGEISIADNKMKLNPGQGITSRAFYDFTNSQAYAQVTQDGTTTNFEFTFFTPHGEGLNMELTGGDTLQFSFTRGNVVDSTTVDYDSTLHKYWRMRERAGLAIWETSPEGSNWTVQRQNVHGADLTKGTLLIQNLSGVFGEGLFGNDNFGGNEELV